MHAEARKEDRYVADHDTDEQAPDERRESEGHSRQRLTEGGAPDQAEKDVEESSEEALAGDRRVGPLLRGRDLGLFVVASGLKAMLADQSTADGPAEKTADDQSERRTGHGELHCSGQVLDVAELLCVGSSRPVPPGQRDRCAQEPDQGVQVETERHQDAQAVLHDQVQDAHPGEDQAFSSPLPKTPKVCRETNRREEGQDHRAPHLHVERDPHVEAGVENARHHCEDDPTDNGDGDIVVAQERHCGDDETPQRENQHGARQGLSGIEIDRHAPPMTLAERLGPSGWSLEPGDSTQWRWRRHLRDTGPRGGQSPQGSPCS